mgnify:CR=1 FL=1
MKAFTLVETLVAISIVVIALMGPFQVVQQGLLASYAARDQLIATALAEEGVEYVRGLRDANYLYNIANPNSPRSWMFGMNGTNGPDCFVAGCVVDPTQGTIAVFASSTAPLKLSTTNVYTQANPSGAVATRFTRKVEFLTASATEVKVTVTVSWRTNNVPLTVRVTNTLHDWL